VPALSPDALQDTAPGESSAVVRSRVVAARDRQIGRYEFPGGTSTRTNSELTAGLMPEHCAIDAAGRKLLASAARRQSLTARGYDRVRKVARTIADLEGVDRISAEHLAEALQFRMI